RGELSRLAAWKLKAKEKHLEFGVGAQGPEVRVKGTQKAINYWALANLVNVNNAGMPESLWDITLNCRHVFHANFQIPDVKRKYGNLTLTYAAQVHAAVVEVDRETFQPKILAYACVDDRSEEHTSELQSRRDLVCRLLLEKKKKLWIAIWD